MPEILREELVHEIFGIILRHLDFFEDDGFFARDFFFGELRREDQIGKNVECRGQMLVDDAGVEADQLLRGECVEHAADAIGFARDVFGGAAFGALEHHVLDEMGDAVQSARFAPRAVLEPDADGNRADVRHRLGNDHEAIREDFRFVYRAHGA